MLDFFAGSGTLGAAAAELGRRYVLIDESPEAVAVMERRLGALQHPDAVARSDDRRAANPRKNPCSTTPGTSETSRASAAGSTQSARVQ